LVSVALAPLTFVERVRGRKRLLVLALYGVVLAVVSAFLWRAMSLRELADVEPFDTRALGTIRVPDADNAYVLYREAARRYKELEIRSAQPKALKGTDWAKADPEFQAWAESNRDAIAVWLRGTERPDALNLQPRDVRLDSRFEPDQTLRSLVTIALLEGSRRERAGDLEGAWTMYRAVLRCSRHVGRHGSIIQRLMGTAMLAMDEPHIAHWIEQQRLTPILIRRARRDLDECAAMTPPLSEAFRVEFFATESALAQPARWKEWGLEAKDDPLQWYNHIPWVGPVKRYFRREPERSRRVLRLVFANIMAQCDRPDGVRPGLTSASYLIYAADDATPPAVRVLGPEKLQRWVEDSYVAPFLPSYQFTLSAVRREAGQFLELRNEMAIRAYTLDHGVRPRRYRDLLGAYLKELPDYMGPDDPIAAPTPRP
jgi:hypothetical protein